MGQASRYGSPAPMNSKISWGSLALFGVLWVALGYLLWARSEHAISV